MDERGFDIICPLLWKMSEACHDKCHCSPFSEAGASAASHTQTCGVYYRPSKAGFYPNPHFWEKKKKKKNARAFLCGRNETQDQWLALFKSYGQGKSAPSLCDNVKCREMYTQRGHGQFRRNMFKNKSPAFSLRAGVGSGLFGNEKWMIAISGWNIVKINNRGNFIFSLYLFLINVIFLFLASWLFQGFGEDKLLLAGLTLI